MSGGQPKKDRRRAILDDIARPGSASGSDASPARDSAPATGYGGFPEPAAELTQEGPAGIRYDFNLGARVRLPPGDWVLKIRDLETASVLHEVRGGDFTFLSRRRYWLNLRLEIEKDGALFWSHDWDGRDRKIAVILPGGTLGDSIAWFTYVARFAAARGCRLHVVLSPAMRDLFRPRYPDLTFLTLEEFTPERRAQMYATYYVGLYFEDQENEYQPADFRLLGLHRTAGAILGVNLAEEPPKIAIDAPDSRPIEAPYVVIAVQASAACKLWNNPEGWHGTIGYLKTLGYRVICIDREPVTGWGLHWNHIPHGCEDQTGDRPLSERARWLKHADFFIGLSSGLSWLAWAAGTPVVMISGFTRPENEFATPWRVFSAHACNSCWHDVRAPFEHHNYLFCPRHKNTPRQFECTRVITAAHVIQTIDRLMGDRKLIPPKKRRKPRL